MYYRSCRICDGRTHGAPNHNVVFPCGLDVVLSPNYRRLVLVPPVDERMKAILIEAINEQGAWFQALEVMPAHIHLLVDVDPQSGLHRLVKALKGRLSRLPRQEIPHLRRRLQTVWTNWYFVAAPGRAPLAAIKRYVKNQRHV